MSRIHQRVLITTFIVFSWLAMQVVHDGVISGFRLWHRQGSHFGLGEAAGQVPGSAVITSALLLIAVILAELIFGSK